VKRRFSATNQYAITSLTSELQRIQSRFYWHIFPNFGAGEAAVPAEHVAAGC
jgi:hypothetical protein